MERVRITQIKSALKKPGNQKKTIVALGLGRINKTVEKEATPQIKGMINVVGHLIKVESV